MGPSCWSPGAAPRCYGSQLTDTQVRVVERLHGVVGHRTVLTQACTLLDQLDLPGAAPLLRASGGTDLVADRTATRDQQLLDRPTRTHDGGDELAMLSSTVDLASLAWSQPGGSPVLAVWSAALASIELLPPARARLLRLPEQLPLTDAQVRRFNGRVASCGGSDRFAPLVLAPRTLRVVAAPMPGGGPRRLRLPHADLDADRSASP